MFRLLLLLLPLSLSLSILSEYRLMRRYAVTVTVYWSKENGYCESVSESGEGNSAPAEWRSSSTSPTVWNARRCDRPTDAGELSSDWGGSWMTARVAHPICMSTAWSARAHSQAQPLSVILTMFIDVSLRRHHRIWPTERPKIANFYTGL